MTSKKRALEEMRITADKITRYKAWQEGRLLPPLKMYIAPTAKCNSRCKYCVHSVARYRRDNYPDDIDGETLLSLIKEALEMGVECFNIVCGGEPLLKKSLTLAMMREIKKGNCDGSLTTNALLLDTSVLAFMIDIKWNNLVISLDSHVRETADALRGEGVYEQCVRVLRELNSLKRTRRSRFPYLALNPVITSLNYRHVDGIIRFAHKHGFQKVIFTPVTIHMDSQAYLKLSPEQSRKFQEVIRISLPVAENLGIETNLESLLDSRITEETGNMISVISSAASQDDYEASEGEMPSRTAQDFPLCFEPWFTIVVHPDGNLNPCQHNSKASPIGSRSLKEAWYDDSFLESMRRMHAKRVLPYFCKKCCSAIVAEHLKEQETVKQQD